MKHVNEITVKPGVAPSPYNEQEKRNVRGFVLSILTLYGNKAQSLREDLAPTLRAFAPDITKFSSEEMTRRIDMVKLLKQAGHEDFKWPDDALAKATATMEILQHEYRKYYPAEHEVNEKKGNRLEQKPSSKKHAKSELDKIKQNMKF